ncbi:MAG: NTP transferase domain-containing protein [Deltaproteobacteria bacterium]|nr:NTP transferase domain-containing protein [Deltaproteobacteria bacterium]
MTSSNSKSWSPNAFRGLIVASGFSSRMGRAKGLLPHPEGETFIQYLVAGFLEAGCVELYITLPVDEKDAFNMERCVKLSCAAYPSVVPFFLQNEYMQEGLMGSIWTFLERVTPELLSSSLGDSAPIVEEIPFVFCPVDLPFLAANELRKLVTGLQKAPVAIPVFEGQRGHPVAVSPLLFFDLRRQQYGGPRALFEKAHVNEIPVFDRRCLWNVNTPEEYKRFLSSW